jgi:hypothetical protein
MFTLAKSLVNDVRRRAQAVRATGDTGLQTVEWIFLVVGILALAAVVMVAVNVFVQGQIGQLPG